MSLVTRGPASAGAAVRLASAVVAVVVTAGAARLLELVVPADLALRPREGEDYRLLPYVPYGADGGIPLVLRAELLPHVLPTSPAARDPGWRAAASAAGDRIEAEPGTHARLLRIDADEVGHPALRVQLLDGTHAGARMFVSRWHLRRAEPPAFVVGLPALCGLVLGLAGGAACWAALTVLGARRNAERSAKIGIRDDGA